MQVITVVEEMGLEYRFIDTQSHRENYNRF